MALAGLLGLFGVPTATAAVIGAAQSVLAPNLFGGGGGGGTAPNTGSPAASAIVPYATDSDPYPTSQSSMSAGFTPNTFGMTQNPASSLVPFGGGLRALPAIESIVPRWLLRAAGSAAIVSAIVEEYRRLRGSGHRHRTARRHALARAGIHVRHRRMRVTNLRALRRATRRLRGFQRAVRKVHGVLPHRGHGKKVVYRYRAAPRRGDLALYEPEDYLTAYEEVEDMGGDPEAFFEPED